MITWSKVSDNVLELANELVTEFHPDLEEARIGFLFRSEASINGGREVWGKAEKVSDKMQAYLDLDFIIWLARDVWVSLSLHQKRALLDHELCHCDYSDGAKIKGHDIEEFKVIIERYGLWRPDLVNFGHVVVQASQRSLPGFEHNGGVFAVEPHQMEVAVNDLQSYCRNWLNLGAPDSRSLKGSGPGSRQGGSQLRGRCRQISGRSPQPVE